MNVVRDLISAILLVLGYLLVGRNLKAIFNNSQRVQFVSPIGCLGTSIFLIAAVVANTFELIGVAVVGIALDNLLIFFYGRSVESQRERGFVPSEEFTKNLRLHLIDLTQYLNGNQQLEYSPKIYNHVEFRRVQELVQGFRPTFYWLEELTDPDGNDQYTARGEDWKVVREKYPHRCIEVLEATGLSHEDAMKDFEKFKLFDVGTEKA